MRENKYYGYLTIRLKSMGKEQVKSFCNGKTLTELQNCWNWQGSLGCSGPSPAQAGPPRAGCPGTCPGVFWRSPRRWLQSLWVACASARLPTQCGIVSLVFRGELLFQFVPVAFVLALGLTEKSLALSSQCSPFRDTHRLKKSTLRLFFSRMISPSSQPPLTGQVLQSLCLFHGFGGFFVLSPACPCLSCTGGLRSGHSTEWRGRITSLDLLVILCLMQWIIPLSFFVQLGVQHQLQVLSCQATFQHVLVLEVIPLQVQDNSICWTLWGFWQALFPVCQDLSAWQLGLGTGVPATQIGPVLTPGVHQ